MVGLSLSGVGKVYNDGTRAKPRNPSGGQRQRVAMGRAIVREPK